MPDVEQLKKNWAFVEEQIAGGNAVSAWAVGFGGVAEGLCKMSFGNSFGVDVNVPEEDLFNYSYGSIILETESDIKFENAQFLGTVTAGVNDSLRINSKNIPMESLLESAFGRYEKVYPATSTPDMKRLLPKGMEGVKPFKAKKIDLKYKGEKIAEPVAYLPVFPGTNCDYDTAKAFRKAGAKVKTSVFRNLTEQDVFDSIDEMKKNIDECQILMFCGGFSAGDEPDGSGKFIANVLNNEKIAAAIEALIARGGLILGICNGFQALIKLGLAAYGDIRPITACGPTLTFNTIGRHQSMLVRTRIASTGSPWLSKCEVGEQFTVAISHGEGRFVAPQEVLDTLMKNGQIATQYVIPSLENFEDEATLESFSEYTADEVAYLVQENVGITVDGYAYKTAIESFNSAKKTIGGITAVGDADATIDDDQIIVHVDVTGANQNAQAEVIFSNDMFLSMESAALNPVESMGGLMTKAALNTLIGMGLYS